jgi:hypothetical protein
MPAVCRIARKSKAGWAEPGEWQSVGFFYSWPSLSLMDTRKSLKNIMMEVLACNVLINVQLA